MSSIASEILRLQTAKADLKTAIEAKGVTVPSSATIDTYDDYIAQISGGGGLSRVTSGTSYCENRNLYCDLITDISIDGGISWVESGRTQILIESGSTQCSKLPIGYTEVEYITSEYLSVSLTDGAYILTNYYPTESTRIVIDFQAKSTTAEHRRLFGAGHCCQNNIAYVFNMEQKYTASNREYTYRCGSGSTWAHTNVPFDLERHTVDFNNNGIIYLDNTQIGQRQTTPFTTSYSLFLFTNNNNGSAGTTQFFIGRIYSCKMYESDTLIRDFVPCTRDSDSKVGLYDVVNDVFYTSATNNQYTASDPV